jgi:DNA-binding transcriptional MerR regulator
MTTKRATDDDDRVVPRTHEDSSGRRAADAASKRMLDIGSEKLYFKIGEVAEIVGVAPHVLRYWETEFPTIKPQKSRSQQRVFRRRDVETLLKIKHLLYDEKFTIAGARRQLRTHREEIPAAAPEIGFRLRQSAGRVREQLVALQTLLRREEHELDRSSADPAAYLRQRGGADALRGGGRGPGERLFERTRPEREVEPARAEASVAADPTSPWPDGEGPHS